MLWKNTTERYGRMTQCLHALIAIIVILLLCVGAWMTGLDKKDPIKFVVYNLHKLTGLTVLTLGVIFIAWKSMNKKPAWPSSMPRWEELAATAAHHSLLLILILMPLSGWLMSSAGGYYPKLFGIELPMPFVPKSRALGDFGYTAHYVLAWLFAGLIVIHVLASLKHHFQEKDTIVKRMWFG